jgi:methyl-accepting chemotaxis protein
MGIRWTIGAKLWALALTAAVLIVGVGLTGLQAVGTLQAALTEVRASGQALRSHMQGDMMHDALRSDVLSALLAAQKGQIDQRDAIGTDIEEHAKIFRDAINAEKQLITDPAALREIQVLLPVLADYILSAEKIQSLAFQDLPAAESALPEFVSLFETLEPQMESVSGSIEKWSEQTRVEADDKASTALTTVASIAVASVILLLITASRIAAAIVKPLQRAVEVTSRIAAGDLDHTIVVTGQDETAQLLEALQRMSRTISEVVAQVREAAESVTSSSREVAAGTLDLSQRVEQQAASLEETSSTTEDMARMVANNASMAGQAGTIAKDAVRRARESRGVVERSAGAMQEINASSSRIAEIIGTIDSIAFQTNLLALNAAVEAARAGEQGRGFAVVATEVRNLAQRCAAAAREIKTLIGDSVEKVQQGTDLVHASGDTIAGTEKSIGDLTGLVENVAESSRDQASGVDQINRAITHMDSATQQNAALVEELAAASASMEGQAQSLLKMVGYFKTGADAGNAALAAPQPEVTARFSGSSRPALGRAPAARKQLPGR